MKKSLILVLTALMLAAMPTFAQTEPEYHVGVNGQAIGPFGIAGIQNMVQKGIVTGATLIWTEGMADWKEAAAVPEVLSALLGTSALPDGKTYRVGDRGPGGGIIFYDKGEFSDGWRYLEVVPVRQESAGQIPDRILSRGTLSKEQLETFLLVHNPALADRMTYVSALVTAYINYANRDGVNYEIAFAQMCYHTRYLSFERIPELSWAFNYAEIMFPGSRTQMYPFNSIEEGVMAHIQHLKGYATSTPPMSVIVDPRYSLIRQTHGLGVSPTLAGLEGRWSLDKGYARIIQNILTDLYETAKR
ncbi:hypothetical protein FACS1894147_04730 [Spirochaetia bacterium]|nr:hypothetical protein FACS1894147_04730 [Spirochaetia bacterium]